MTNIVASESVNALWGSDWQEVRNEWRSDRSTFFFCHGAYGAVPTKVREYQAGLTDRIDRNPTGFFRRELDSLLEAARLEAAGFCGASPDGLAWIRNASEGMTVAIAAIPLMPGDEILVTNHVYPAVRSAAESKCKATGAKLVEVQLPFTDDDAILTQSIADGMTKRTRLFLVDEIAAATARVFPIRELAKITRERGIVLVVDGAHAPGMYPISIDTLGADIWVGNFHKWVCAPQGAAAIWATSEWREKLRPSAVSYRDGLAYPNRFGRLGTDDMTAMLSVPFAIKFLQRIGLEKIYRYNAELVAYGAEAIRTKLGTPKIAGRYACRHPIALPAGVAEDEVSALALQTHIATQLHTELSVVPPVGAQQHASIIVSAFIYNHPREYEQFATLLPQFLKEHKI